MPRTRQPRSGSMQFWPRVRSRYSYPRIRNWPAGKEPRLLGFAGYKVGMTHLIINDNRQSSLTKGTEISCPITVIECPPLKTASIMFYKNTNNGTKLVAQLFADSLDKEVARNLTTPKKKGKEPDDYDIVRLLCYTQPKMTNIGKKKPDMFEVAIGGTKDQQLNYAKEKLGKEIAVNEVFKEGQQLDTHSISKGKGFQGPMKRFGITLRHHKSEKSRRNPGSLGSWQAQGQIMWRTAHAGKMGFHLRTEYNKWLVKIGNKSDEINVKGGYVHYGFVKNSFMLIKGGITGSQKRLVRFTDSIRPRKVMPEAPQVTYISTESKQGR